MQKKKTKRHTIDLKALGITLRGFLASPATCEERVRHQGTAPRRVRYQKAHHADVFRSSDDESCTDDALNKALEPTQ